MNILIVEDHALTAKLIARSLEALKEIDIIGIASNGKEAVSSVEENKVDVVLMDINLPYLDGIQATEMILKKSPDTKILMISGHTEAWIIKKSLSAGALGYISKKVGYEVISDAINVVFNGHPYLDDQSLRTIVDDYDYGYC